MLLVIDMGNTNVGFGAMDEKKLYFEERLRTNPKRPVAHYVSFLNKILTKHNMSVSDFEGAILSSVVPSGNKNIVNAIKQVFGLTCKVLGPDLITGMTYNTENPAQIGPDLIAGCAGAMKLCKLPVAVVDMGTATTIFVVDENKCFLGGIIHPGIRKCLMTLVGTTEMLPNIKISKPNSAVPNDTGDCMVSGILYGHAGIIDKCLQKMEEELGRPLDVVATGGLSRFVIPHCERKIKTEFDLIYKGLYEIYYMNV